MSNYSYVTLVAFGGTPVRLANQTGAAYATTGTGALVFANGATLTNPIISGVQWDDPQGLDPGTAAAPSLYFTYTNNHTNGLYSSAVNNVDVTCAGARVANFSATGLSLTGALAISGNITSGVWLGTVITVPKGGTGAATWTQNGVIYGNAASTLGATAAGTTGQVLVGTTGSAPSWAALAGIGVTSISFGTTGLTPNSATVGAVTVAGTLIAANGGTGIASYAVGDILYANTTTTLAKLADIATGNALISGGISTAPSWGKIGLTTHVDGILAPANGGSGVANNAASTITISGAYALTATLSNTTSVTFPTTGTLATLAGSEALTNKTYNGNTFTAGTGVLTIAASKTLTISNTITFTATDGSTLAIGTGGTLGTNAYTSTAYAPVASPTFTGTVTIPTPFTLGATSVTATGTQINYLAAATGTTGTTSTNVVFSESPTLTSPNIGAATGTSISTTAAHTAFNATAIPAGGTAGSGYLFSSAANFGLFFGSGVPTLSAARGSFYLRSDGTPYYNTDGATAWSASGGNNQSTTGVTFQKLTSGSAATYTTATGAKWIRIRMVGGGGGGSGSGGTNGAGGNGGNTTFSGGTLTAGGGTGGLLTTQAGGAGGTVTNGNGLTIQGMQGGYGSDLAALTPGGSGGSSLLGPGSPSGTSAAALNNAPANSGGGGGGGQGTASAGGGGGGGSGGYIEHVIVDPAATYTYTIGAAGTAGTAGAGGSAGMAGGTGYIIVEEHYNY